MNQLYIIIIEYTAGFSSDIDDKMQELLSSIGQEMRLTEHSYFLSTDATPVIIRDAIKNSPYNVERIFVAQVSSPSAWRNLISDNSDIKAFLRNEF